MNDYVEAFLGNDHLSSAPVIAPSPQRYAKDGNKKQSNMMRSLKSKAANLRSSSLFRRQNKKNGNDPIDVSLPSSRSRKVLLHVQRTLKKSRSFGDMKDVFPEDGGPFLPLYFPQKGSTEIRDENETDSHGQHATRITTEKNTKDDDAYTFASIDRCFSEELWRLSEQDCVTIVKNHSMILKSSSSNGESEITKAEKKLACSGMSGGSGKETSEGNLNQTEIPLVYSDSFTEQQLHAFPPSGVRESQSNRRPSITEMFQCSINTVASWDFDDIDDVKQSTFEYEEEKPSKEQKEKEDVQIHTESHSQEPNYEILAAFEGCSVSTRVLSPAMMSALRSHLPFAVSQNNYWLKYTMIRDGSSLRCLFTHIEANPRIIIAIETMKGEVFGSYTGTQWTVSGLEYYGSGEAFLWKLKTPKMPTYKTIEDQVVLESELEVFPWTGKNRNVQCLPNLHGSPIIIGGGEDVMSFSATTSGYGAGLMIDQDLSRGTTDPCLTFQSPALCDDKEFEIKNIEVWTLTPVTTIEQAESLEQSLKIAKDNSRLFRQQRRTSI